MAFIKWIEEQGYKVEGRLKEYKLSMTLFFVKYDGPYLDNITINHTLIFLPLPLAI